jgi:hypothetical protein
VRARAALALLAVGLAAPAARGEVCRATASGTWGPIGAGSATWSCTGGPDASDRFVVPAGVTVSVVADVVQDPGSLLGIRVDPGGTLVAAVSPATGALVLRLGGSGLDCAGTCTLHGGYRTLGRSPPGVVADFDAPAAAWPLRSLLPCAGDCTATPERQRLAFAPASAKARASLAAVVPGRDVACFWDPQPGDLEVSAETNQCFAIAARGAGASGWLDLDVRQGRRDQSGAPLARRRIRALALAGAVAAGARRIPLPAALLSGPAEDGLYAGRWLRFADAQGGALGTPVKILRAEDGGAGDDVVVLGDPRGVPQAHAAGEPVWIDYGFAPGDPFQVMAPVRIESSTPAPGDSPALFTGTAELRAVVFDDLRGVTCSACQLDVREYWLVDPANSGSSAFFVTGTLGGAIERGNQTGGDDRPGADVTHGLTIPGNTALRVADVSIRYHGDDAVGMGAAATQGTIERLHVAMRSDHANSCNCLNNTGSRPHQMTQTDVVCDDATDDDVNLQMAITAGGGSSLDGVMIWGSRGPVVNNASPQRLAVTDLFVAGVDTAVGHPFLPDDVAGFVVRDVVQRRNAGTADLCLSNLGTAYALRDGVVRDVRTASTHFCLLASGGSGLVENVAIVDAESDAPSCADGTGTGCAAVGIDTPRGVTLRDVSLVWRDGVATNLVRGLGVTGGPAAPGDLVLDGLLVHGFRGTGENVALATVGAAAIFDPAAPVSGPCLSANERNANADFLASAPASTWTGTAPGFADLANGRVDPVPGGPADTVGCGVRRGVASPGISRFRWMHAVSKIGPERLADDADGDGVPEDPLAPRCTDGQRDGCDDLCPGAFDPAQRDSDGDGAGDACDVACSDGEDDDGDGLADFPADPGCSASADVSERSPALACDDGVDQDGDFAADGRDPGCAGPLGAREDPACDNGLDDDGDGRVDGADPTCAAAAWRVSESGGRCGLGAELAVALALLARARRALGSRR